MDRKEYDKMVDYVIENDGLGMPEIILKNFRDYDSWESRLSTARWAAVWSKREESEVRKDVLKGSLDIMEDTLNTLMKEYEPIDNHEYEQFIDHKIWALKDIAWLRWRLHRDDEKALEYIDEALEILEKGDFRLTFSVRGMIYKTKWDILLELNKGDEVLQEIENVVDKYKDADKFKESRLYYSYLTKAEIEKKKGNMEKALDYLKESLSYFPLDQHGNLEKLDLIWKNRHDDYENTYVEMNKLTHYEVAWDFIDYDGNPL